MSEDIRWGFEVSEKRKEVWSIEIRMLFEVQKICKKHNLKYYAIAGTLLGAVRHKGFIPWDDDLDIAMPRNDYEKFLMYAVKELPSECKLQTPWTDIGYFQGHAKLRMDGTTAIRQIQWKEGYKFNQGIFIDVFPLDNIPDNPMLKRIHRYITMRTINRVNMGRYYYSNIEHNLNDKKLHQKMKRKYHDDRTVLKTLSRYDKWCSMFNGNNTKKWGMLSAFYYRDDIFSWDRKYFDETVELDFENVKITCPREWNAILTENYGDYMRPVKGTNQHGDIFFDTKKSYIYYIDRFEEYGIREDGYIL